MILSVPILGTNNRNVLSFHTGGRKIKIKLEFFEFLMVLFSHGFSEDFLLCEFLVLWSERIRYIDNEDKDKEGLLRKWKRRPLALWRASESRVWLKRLFLGLHKFCVLWLTSVFIQNRINQGRTQLAGKGLSIKQFIASLCYRRKIRKWGSSVSGAYTHLPLPPIRLG